MITCSKIIQSRQDDQRRGTGRLASMVEVGEKGIPKIEDPFGFS